MTPEEQSTLLNEAKLYIKENQLRNVADGLLQLRAQSPTQRWWERQHLLGALVAVIGLVPPLTIALNGWITTNISRSDRLLSLATDTRRSEEARLSVLGFLVTEFGEDRVGAWANVERERLAQTVQDAATKAKAEAEKLAAAASEKAKADRDLASARAAREEIEGRGRLLAEMVDAADRALDDAEDDVDDAEKLVEKEIKNAEKVVNQTRNVGHKNGQLANGGAGGRPTLATTIDVDRLASARSRLGSAKQRFSEIDQRKSEALTALFAFMAESTTSKAHIQEQAAREVATAAGEQAKAQALRAAKAELVLNSKRADSEETRSALLEASGATNAPLTGDQETSSAEGSGAEVLCEWAPDVLRVSPSLQTVALSEDSWRQVFSFVRCCKDSFKVRVHPLTVESGPPMEAYFRTGLARHKLKRPTKVRLRPQTSLPYYSIECNE